MAAPASAYASYAPPNDPFMTGAAAATAPGLDPAFKELVSRGLYFHNIPVNNLTPTQFDEIARKLWAHPLLQEAFNEAMNPTGSSVTITTPDEVSTLIGRELFDPGSSSSPDLLSVGYDLKQQFGVPLTAPEKTYHIETNAKVPVPFSPDLFSTNRTEYFGQVTQFGTEPGNDYGMAPGTPIVSPFSGAVSVEDQGKGAWGKRVIITLDTPVTMPDGTQIDQIAVGHLSQFAVTSGHVDAGDVAGYSGGDPSDPSSGISDGAHIEFQTLSGGRFVDPAPLLQQLYAGTTFQDLGALGMTARQLTPDEQQLRSMGIYSTALNSANSGAVTAWRKYFGSEPSTSALLGVLAHGQDAQQYEDYIRSLDSPSLPGYNVGTVFDARAEADKVSQSIYGHDSNLGIVKDLLDQGMHSPSDVQFYYDDMQFKPGRDVSAQVYNTAYAANRPWSMGVFNSEPDPRVIQAQVTAAAGAAPTLAQSNLAAQSLAVPDVPGPSVDENSRAALPPESQGPSVDESPNATRGVPVGATDVPQPVGTSLGGRP